MRFSFTIISCFLFSFITCVNFNISNGKDIIVDDQNLNKIKYYQKIYYIDFSSEEAYAEWLKLGSTNYFEKEIVYYNYRGDYLKIEDIQYGFTYLVSYSYNESNNTIIRTWVQVLPETTKALDAFDIFYLDMAGNRIKVEQYENNKIKSYTSYIYNGNGQLIEYMMIFDGNISAGEKYEYRDDKRIRAYNYSLGELVIIKTSLLFDNKERIIKERVDYYNGDTKKNYFRIHIYEYFDLY